MRKENIKLIVTYDIFTHNNNKRISRNIWNY